MKRISPLLVATLILAIGLVAVATHSRATPPDTADASSTVSPQRGKTSENRPTVDEAREQAAVLHETVHATLQIVHHQYYREDEGLLLPAATLKRMFREVAERRRIEMQWLAVEGEAMNIEHLPEGKFETAAAAALAAGKEAYEETAGGVYRRAGPITLGSDCLKCHVPNRKSTEDRTAGLIIAIPVADR
jgi:histone H3/H4